MLRRKRWFCCAEIFEKLYNFSIDDVGKIVEMYYKKQTE